MKLGFMNPFKKQFFSKSLFNFSKKPELIENRQGLILNLEDKPGSLVEILQVIKNYNLNISYISSKPCPHYEKSKKIDFYVDIEKVDNEANILNAINDLNALATVSLNTVKNIPWFPKNFSDLNKMGKNIKVGGDTLQSDHPGFNDVEYKKRRNQVEAHSQRFNFSDTNFVEHVNYTEDELELWRFMYDKLKPLQEKYSCDEYRECMEKFEKEKVFSRDKVPQISEINEYFKSSTNMLFRPTGGLLTEREFLNSLAFRVFPSTQYLRHKAKPLYTPEPDIIHEFLGHACMFANKEFTEFSQEIGLASLGASDEDIKKLGTIYWYTIEFGLCKQGNKTKIYGGGILSSPSEIENSVSNRVKLLDFDLKKMSVHPVDICNIQTEYYLAPSFEEMRKQVKEYSHNINKSFNVTYNLNSKVVEVDRRIELNF